MRGCSLWQTRIPVSVHYGKHEYVWVFRMPNTNTCECSLWQIRICMSVHYANTNTYYCFAWQKRMRVTVHYDRHAYVRVFRMANTNTCECSVRQTRIFVSVYYYKHEYLWVFSMAKTNVWVFSLANTHTCQCSVRQTRICVCVCSVWQTRIHLSVQCSKHEYLWVFSMVNIQAVRLLNTTLRRYCSANLLDVFLDKYIIWKFIVVIGIVLQT
jgi:hypothetical protein